MKNLLTVLVTLFVANLGAEAHAELRRVRINEQLYTENIPTSSPEANADTFRDMTIFARMRKLKEDSASGTSSDSCMSLIRQAAEEGECSVTFSAASENCPEEEANGCYETKGLRKKLKQLGFKVFKSGRSADGEACESIRAQWCTDIAKATFDPAIE